MEVIQQALDSDPGALQASCAKYLPWVCPCCTFENHQYPSICELCEELNVLSVPTGFVIDLSEGSCPVDDDPARAIANAVYDRVNLRQELRTFRLPESNFLSNQVARLDFGTTTRDTLFDDYVMKSIPFVMTGLMEGAPTGEAWPARRWAENRCERLRASVGDRAIKMRIPPCATPCATATHPCATATHPGATAHGDKPGTTVFGDMAVGSVYEYETVTMNAFLDSVWEEASPNAGRYYAARVELTGQLPPLAADCPSLAEHPLASCCGKATSCGAIAYFGGGAQATPLHFDDGENFFHVLHGAKIIWIAPPGESGSLSPSGAGARSTIYSALDAHAVLNQLEEHGPEHPMPCTGAVAGLVDVLKHRSVRVELRAGDMLYLPIGWWHAVRGGNGPNISVNFFYGQHEDKVDQSDAAVMRSMLSNAVPLGAPAST